MKRIIAVSYSMLFCLLVTNLHTEDHLLKLYNLDYARSDGMEDLLS